MQGLEDGGFGLGLQGVRAAAIYRGARPLGVWATKAAAACGVARSDSQWSPARAREVGGDPDRRAPSVGGLREGEVGTGWAGGRRWAGGGGLAREGERKKKGEVGLGWNQGRKRERKKKGFAFFLKLFQTIQFKFKFREFKFKLTNKQ